MHTPQPGSVLPDVFLLPPPPPVLTAPAPPRRTPFLLPVLGALLGSVVFLVSILAANPLGGGAVSSRSPQNTSALTDEICSLAGNRLAGFAPQGTSSVSTIDSGTIDADLYEHILGRPRVFFEPGCKVSFLLGLESYAAVLYAGDWGPSTLSVRSSLQEANYPSPFSGAPGQVSILPLTSPPNSIATLYRFELSDDLDTDADFEAVYVEYDSGVVLVYEPWYVGSVADLEADLQVLVPLLA